MSKIMKMSRTLFNDFTDEQGNLLEQPKNSIGKKNLPEEHVRYLKRYLEFLLNSKILNKAARIYIQSPHTTLSVAATAEFYNRQNPENKVNVKTFISNIDYCRKKLSALFDDDMLERVIYYSGTCDLEKYQTQLEKAIGQYAKADLFKGKLLIELSASTKPQEVDETRIKEFMDIIEPYRTHAVKTVEKLVASEYEDVIGYFGYLTSSVRLTDEQERQLQEMTEFLNPRKSSQAEK